MADDDGEVDEDTDQDEAQTPGKGRPINVQIKAPSARVPSSAPGLVTLAWGVIVLLEALDSGWIQKIAGLIKGPVP